MHKLTYLWYLLWLLPLYLFGMAVHMGAVYYGLDKTWEEGESYLADIVHFEIKQIAAQTNGSITVRFETDDGEEITRKLSQPIQNAAQLQASEMMPIRFMENSYQPVVLVPIYDFHKQMVLVNLAVLLVAIIITFFIALTAHRFASRKIGGKDPEQKFEIIDS
ncbi:hypothetical protein [Natronogracilivirga saccharolytica]|uniref:Uncharacterized protein n=1 Tax=Natronogracilivirga saccharolytica TaxID=2812953 RepID=A0A8J7UWH6_9BACT|nr:hypothetical protein [Natronogracilivirga saccharolytica]MBP3193637.1 hypothetical protein [Natronogracilivirga saccharolytica]